ncbi:MAG: NIF family HAD-type phosphatase [Pseudomonadota bacterium]
MNSSPHDKAEAIIWDLDNTLYRFTSEMKEDCNIAAAHAAIAAGIDKDFEELLIEARASEKEYGYSLHNFVKEYGVPYSEMHHPFHEAIDETKVDIIAGLPEFIEALELNQFIYTNASREWADRVLKFIGLNHLFKDTQILCMEDFNYEPKARTDKGLSMVLDKLGSPKEKTISIDDMERNLLFPYIHGLKTILVHDEFDAEHVLHEIECPTRLSETNLI